MAEQGRVVLMTAPDRATAEGLAETLVEERLVACVNVLPGVTSVYRWEGEVERDEELLLVLKTAADRVEALVRRAVDIHPYDVPEVLVLPVEEGHGAYLTWVRTETRPHTAPDGASSSG